MALQAVLAGYGRFGKLFHQAFGGTFSFSIYDPPIGITCGEAAFANAEYLFLAMPMRALEQFIAEQKAVISPACALVDLFSVKEYPMALLRGAFPANTVIGTHPLFGPDSAAGGLAGHQIVVVPGQEHTEAFALLTTMFTKAGLTVITMSAEEHDRQMAWTLCLTQFIGRGLEPLPLPANGIGTKGYFDLQDIVSRAKADTPVLFEDMNRYNRFAGEMRQMVWERFKELDGQF